MIKSVQTYKDLSIGDKVMKKSIKPFLFSYKSKETLLFHGTVSKIIITKKGAALFSLKNGNYRISGIQYNDIIHLNKEQLTKGFSIWRMVNRITENLCFDFRFSCITGFTYKPKEKEKYDDKLKAFLAAYSLQCKNENKKYSVYKCSHCNFYHVGGEAETENLDLIEKNILPLIGLS